MQVAHLYRDEFLSDYLDVQPGEHLNIVSPTGGGKSYFLNQIVEKVNGPDTRMVSFMPKPSDETSVAWSRKLGLKEIPDWPPRRYPWQDEPPGYVLWPPHIRDDEEANRENLARVFRQAINDQYWHGNSLTVVDDTYLVGVLYGLNPELDRHWIAGRSNNASLFTSLQKPSGTTRGAVSSFAYDSPTHLLMGRDNDERNLQRISEIAISQVDPQQIKDIVRHLPVHRVGNSAVSEMLYLDRRGPYMAVIGT
jgi:hypothetical protein